MLFRSGASVLARGEEGMKESHLIARDFAIQMAQVLTQFKGVKLAFDSTPFYNEFVLELPILTSELIKNDGLKLPLNNPPTIEDEISDPPI